MDHQEMVFVFLRFVVGVRGGEFFVRLRVFQHFHVFEIDRVIILVEVLLLIRSAFQRGHFGFVFVEKFEAVVNVRFFPMRDRVCNRGRGVRRFRVAFLFFLFVVFDETVLVRRQIVPFVEVDDAGLRVGRRGTGSERPVRGRIEESTLVLALLFFVGIKFEVAVLQKLRVGFGCGVVVIVVIVVVRCRSAASGKKSDGKGERKRDRKRRHGAFFPFASEKEFSHKPSFFQTGARMHLHRPFGVFLSDTILF